MNQSQFVQISVFLVAATVSMSQAQADSAPPQGYVEQCTLVKQQVDGKSCVSCSANFRDVNACNDVYASQGYTKACKALGASVWTEVWCKTGADNLRGGGPNQGVGGAAVVNADPSEEPGCGCRISGRSGRSAAGATLGMMVLAWLGLRLRRRGA